MKNPFKKNLFKKNLFKKETKTSDVAYKIRVGTIREVTLEELVRLTYYDNVGAPQIPIIQYASDYLIYNYITTANYVGPEKLVSWLVVTESYYCKVNEFKKFIFFDDFNSKLEYTNNVEEKTSISTTSCIIPIISTLDDVSAAIVRRIKIKEALEKKD